MCHRHKTRAMKWGGNPVLQVWRSGSAGTRWSGRRAEGEAWGGGVLPLRQPAVGLDAGRLGEAEPGLARALLAGCCRSPGAITPPDPQEAAVRPSGAEWKRWNEGKRKIG